MSWIDESKQSNSRRGGFLTPLKAEPFEGADRSAIKKPGWLARFKSVGWMRLHRSAARAGDKVQLVLLWPVSVARTALASRQSISTGEGRTRSEVQLCFHCQIIHRTKSENVR